MSRINEEFAIGASLLAIGLAALTGSFLIEPDFAGNTGARVFPIMGACVLMILGMLQLRLALVANVSAPAKQNKGGLRGPFLLLALVVAYLWLIGKLGYLIATGLAAPATLALFGIRNPIGLLIAAFAVPAIYHLIFFELLGVFPPYGLWFDLLDVIGG